MESGTINNAGAEPVGDAVILFKALLAVPMGSAVPNWGQIDVYSSEFSFGKSSEGFGLWSPHLTMAVEEGINCMGHDFG